MSPAKVLLVDDDSAFARSLQLGLSTSDLEVEWVASVAEAREALDTVPPPDAMLLDVDLGAESGLDFLVELSRERPEVAVVMLTGSRRFEHAIHAWRHGARDYLVKPLAVSELRIVLRNILDLAQARRELNARRLLDDNEVIDAGRVVFASAPMKQALSVLERIKDNSAPVLLLGETGTGKEVLARWLHESGARSAGPFIDVNCASLPRELAESALFGHEEGAFTGATSRATGYFEKADGGVIFLDEVGELPFDVQAKLLRVLENGGFDRVGGGRVQTDARVLAATNRDLAADVAAGRFRSDLYYRLEVLVIRVPPLRERPEDILPLAEHFMAGIAEREGGPPKRLGDRTRDRLLEHAWPGNARELRNCVTRAYLLGTDSEIRVEDLNIEAPAPSSSRSPRLNAVAERRRMLEALARCRGNVTAAAKDLGIGRATFYRRAKQLELDF